MRYDSSMDYPKRQVHMWQRPGMFPVSSPGEEPAYSPIVQAETRIETYYMHEEIDPLFLRQSRDGLQYFLERMEKQFRDHVSYYGMLIEDSMQVGMEDDIYIRDGRMVIKVLARVICPTITEPVSGAPKRTHCQHCNTYSFEDQFHSGTCENCGAPYGKSPA